MALTRKNPNTILLSERSGVIIDDELVATEAITPGFLVELVSDSGTLSWQKHDAAADQCPLAIALDNPARNKGIDDDYADGDRVMVAWLRPGCVFYGEIPSGQNIAVGDYLQSNGNGQLKEATANTATANVAKFQALDGPGSVAADTRLRVVVIQ